MRRTRKRSTGHVGSSLLTIVFVIAIIILSKHYKAQNNIIAALNTNMDIMREEIKTLKETIKTQEKEITLAKEQASMRETGSNDIPTVSYTNISIRHKDLREFELINSDQMNEWINDLTKHNTESPFRGQGEVFIKASKESGLDPRYILAHAALESAWGTSYLARTKYNYFGIAAYDNSPNSAYAMGDCLESGIINGAKWIASNYTDQGQHSLHLMIYGKKRYASDDEWINKIANIMLKCNKNDAI